MGGRVEPLASMNRFIIPVLLASTFSLMPLKAEDPTGTYEGHSASNAPPVSPGWYATVRGAYAHQFESGLNGGGDFSVNRVAIETGAGYMPEFTRRAGLSVGYDLNDYSFSGTTAVPVWGKVHTLKLAAPVRWAVDDQWTIFAVPVVRWTAEDGADWGQAIGGGGFAGVSYRFGEKLTLGPGFGALTQIEADPSFFPVILVQWKITDRLDLETGRGLGASQGPGLTLSYDVADDWRLVLGGRYEKLRFRLSSSSTNPDGVGEDRGGMVYLGLTWKLGPTGTVSLLGGARFAGRLRVDDSFGSELASADYDIAPYAGFSFGLRF
jgi:hypothetical protein